MRQRGRQAVPIRKTSLSTEDAVELFRSRGMLDKAQLLSFRISSRVNVYSLEDFSDYFYGYMVPDTSYLKWFALQIFEDGFVLRLPGPLPPWGVPAPHQGLSGPPRRHPPFGGPPHLQRGGDEPAYRPGRRHPDDPGSGGPDGEADRRHR